MKEVGTSNISHVSRKPLQCIAAQVTLSKSSFETFAGLKIRAGHWSMTSQNTQMTSQIASKKYLIGKKLNSARERNRLSIQVLSYFPVEESAKLH